jgi:hypothetical protein
VTGAAAARAAITAIALVAVAILSGAATAQDLRAAGRITFADGTGGCSGSLIRPDLVLTAGHCLPAARDGTVLGPGDFAFAPALGTGAPGTAVTGAAILRHPLWDQLPEATRGRIRFDMALLRLSRPLDASEAVPLPLADPDADAGRGFVVSFRGDSPRGPRQRQTACPVLDRADGTLSAACEVRSGESGSPFLVRGPDGGLAILAVTVARTERGNRPVAIAVDLARAGGPLFDLLADADRAQPPPPATLPQP